MKPYSKELTGEAGKLFGPGAQFPQQNVAPFSPDQLAAQQDTRNLTGPEQQYLGQAQQEQGATASGKYLDPSTNKYLQSYYNAAADPMMQDYKNTIAPNLVGNAVASGGLGSSGSEQAFSNAQHQLGQGLATLGADIYEPAYQQERQLQQNAQQYAPQMAGAQYLPGQMLNQSGQEQQQQQQNVLNTIFQNAMMPYQMLNQGANLISPLSGGAGSQIQISPNPMQTSK